MLIIGTDAPLAIAVVEAIHTGDIEALRQLLAEDPELANTQLDGPDNKGDGGMTRTLLQCRNGLAGALPERESDRGTAARGGRRGCGKVDARFTGLHNEAPLHWAASSDDVEYSTYCSTPEPISKPLAR